MMHDNYDPSTEIIEPTTGIPVVGGYYVVYLKGNKGALLVEKRGSNFYYNGNFCIEGGEIIGYIGPIPDKL